MALAVVIFLLGADFCCLAVEYLAGNVFAVNSVHHGRSARCDSSTKNLAKQLELKDESMSTNENPLGGRGRSEEERWARQQQQEAIEKMKKGGATPATGPGAGPGTAPAAGSAPVPAKAPAKDSKK